MTPTATHINYYFFCERKLWLFAHGIQCEQESDLVRMGKLIHETSYQNKKKEIALGPIKIDWIDHKNKVIHEVKKSKSAEEAHEWQLKYYIYYFNKIGIEGFTGELNYPKLKKITRIELSDEDTKKLDDIIEKVEEIYEKTSIPKQRNNKSCKTCSYFELCRI